jgi:hypothetical protein
MAKISFNKLTPIKSVDPTIVTIGENEITVERYLPMADKAAFVERVLNAVIDDTGFINPMRLDVMFHIELIKTYTNISITDKMMENAGKTYDLLEINNILNTIIDAIPETEYQNVLAYVEGIIERIVTFNHSFVGSMRTMLKDYSVTDLDVKTLMDQLKDVEKSEVLQNVMQQLN